MFTDQECATTVQMSSFNRNLTFSFKAIKEEEALKHFDEEDVFSSLNHHD
jgi:hypothetical protein